MSILNIKPEGRLPPEVTGYLLPHERTAISVHRHPAIFVIPVGLLVASCVAAGILTAFVISDNAVVLGLVWGVCFALLVYLLAQVAAWWRSYFVVTRARIIFIRGLVARKVTTIPLVKITNLTLRRSSMGSLLGYGTIVADLAGSDSIPINYMPYPEQLFLEVCEVAQIGDYAEDEAEPEPEENI
jgi:membrane protein YdbS with pleckstrin-like domain